MKIKYLPTGNVFDLPKSECERIYKESPFNYEILDGHFDLDEKEPKSTVASKVLGNDAETAPNAKMTFEQLKEIALKNGISEELLTDEKGKNIKKADLLKLIEENQPDEDADGEDETDADSDEDETDENEE